MNIVINIDRKFLKIASVMLFSLFDNHREELINVYILNDDLTDNDIKWLENELGLFEKKFIHDIKVLYDYFTLTDNEFSTRWGKQVYYRLLASELLPVDVKRVLYLDTDIVVDGSLMDLYNIDMDGNYICACIDTEVSDECNNDRINLKKTSVYYNSGVILLDLNKIRNDNIINSDVIKGIIKRFGDKLFFPDQDILNIVFEGKIEHIDFRRYNFLCSRGRYSARKLKYYGKKAVIFHYGGGMYHRPWEKNYVGKFGDKFWKYANKTSFRQEYNKIALPNRCFKLLYIIHYELHIFKIKVKGKIHRWKTGQE